MTAFLLRRVLFAGLASIGAMRLSAEPGKSGAPIRDSELLSGYLAVSKALAADDFKAARTAAVELTKQAEADGMVSIVKVAKALASAPDIARARGAFRALTTEIEPLAEGAKGYTIMYCRMADSDWIQPSGAVQNPYFGQAMPHCGVPKKSK